MPIDAAVLENIANSALDYHEKKGKVEAQERQDRPLLRAMRKRKKTFPGGKGEITRRVKGAPGVGIEGFEYDDEVGYTNPTNTRTVAFPYKEIHSGISVTLTELKRDGITFSDTTTGDGERKATDREMTMLANIFEEKLDDMQEGWERGMNNMAWLDGSQDSKQAPGIMSFIVDDPTASLSVGGLSQATNTWWRNRAVLGIDAGTASNQNIVDTFQSEFRQLKRYTSKANLIALAGSDFLTAMEQELRAKGVYTETGWAGQGRIDGSVSELAFKGVGIDYDPTLDDLGKSKYCYVLDLASLYMYVMDGEDGRIHKPARPENKYVLYRSKTWTGGFACWRRNSSGVYSIA